MVLYIDKSEVIKEKRVLVVKLAVLPVTVTNRLNLSLRSCASARLTQKSTSN